MNHITDIAEIVAEAVQTQIDHDDKIVTLTEIERTTRQLLQTIGQAVIGKLVEQAAQYSDPIIDCDCGESAVYVHRRPATLHTLFGVVKVKRAYYLCASCRSGCFPQDKTLGLRPNSLSAEVSRLAAMTGVQLPYQTGCDLFQALTLVQLIDNAMSKATCQVGQLVAEKEAADGEWRIVADNISYYTNICHAAQFGELLWATGVQRQAQLAGELILIGDGAEWIWNLAAAHFPKAVQILDWFHASDYLMPVAQAVWQTEDAQREWVRQQRDLLWRGKFSGSSQPVVPYSNNMGMT